MKSFTEFIRSKVFISDEALQEVLLKFQEKELSAIQIILKEWLISNQYYFILSGGLRFFSLQDNTEHIAWVFFEGEFITEISSFAPC